MGRRTRGLLLAGVLATGGVLAARRLLTRSLDGRRPRGPQMLVLGGGWAGIYAALTLEKVLPEAQVTLVNRDNFFLFTPMLPEVAASAVDTRHIVNPIRRLFKHVTFLEGDVEAIDLEQRKVLTRHPSGHRHELSYEHLVLALGGVTNFYGMEDVVRESISLKTLGDAIELRNHLVEMLEQADIEQCDLRKELATFVLVGGGLNGVEVAGNINDFVRDALPSYPNIPPDEVRMILAEALPRLMPEVSESLAAFALRKLQERGIEVWLNARVTGASARSVRFADGREVATRTLVWMAGIAANPLLAGLPVQRDKKGRVVVDRYLRVSSFKGVWAVGDCAAVPDQKGGTYPPTAQHALREARAVALNIAAEVRGSPLTAFSYALQVRLAAIGHQAGVAEIMGHKLSGLLPWWLWRSYYLWRLPRLEKQVRVMLDWTLDLFFPRDIVQTKMGRDGRESQAASATEPTERERGT